MVDSEENYKFDLIVEGLSKETHHKFHYYIYMIYTKKLK